MAWSNSDATGTKPKIPVERQVREVKQLVTSNSTSASSNTIYFTYNDGGQNNVANVGIVVGQYVYATNLSSGGLAGFFSSNNTVKSISANSVTVTNNTFGIINAGVTIGFDSIINYNTANNPNFILANTFADTILVTASRLSNVNTSITSNGSFNTGWNHVRKKTNSDGTVRYLRETLVCIANAVATTTASGNTHDGQIFRGL
jgi:hypothetical protein